MKSDSIKMELIEWLNGLDDAGILTSLLQFKKSTESKDWADNLTNDQIESLQRGLSDVTNKRLISGEDLRNSYGRKS
jgi:hypothetical protein